MSRPILALLLAVITACSGRTEESSATLQASADPPAAVASEQPDSAALDADVRRIYDALFAFGPSRAAARARLGPPVRSQIHPIQSEADRAQRPLTYVVRGDTVETWYYAGLELDFRVRTADTLVAVRAAPAHASIAALTRRLSAPPSGRLVPRFFGFAALHDTLHYTHTYLPDSLVTLKYVRDTLRQIELSRGGCGPGPEC